MANIGLITFLSENYGTILQAYALKKAIEEISGILTFIDFERSENANTSKQKSIFQSFFKRISPRIIGIVFLRRVFKRKSLKFKSFIETHIRATGYGAKTIASLQEQARHVDIMICGSDMMWSAEFEKYLNVYLLTWFDRKKISYAPSIGDIQAAISLKHIYKKALMDFSALSCREKSASTFIANITGRNVVTVPDPTLLFDRKQWLNFLSINLKETIRYVLVYCFSRPDKVFSKHISKFCKNNSLIRRNILVANINDYLKEIKFDDGIYGPIEFVKFFSQASFTIVDGYHGLIFSLIFEKPFVVVHRGTDNHWRKHENRMMELLQLLNLENRYISPNDGINEDFFNLDYSSIREKVTELRKHGWNYLKNAINEQNND